jgi:hypothetical protein
VAAAGILAGCGNDAAPPAPDGGQYQPSEAQPFTVRSPSKDEDPSVVRGQDGRMYVAWFSERTQWAEIYVASSADGQTWTAPVAVTVSNGGNFNPSLYQDAQGTFHIAWFRWESFFKGHIWYNTSVDGQSWDSNAEVQVTTTADVDDWVPALTQAPDGTLLVYFVSNDRDTLNATNEIYVATKGLTDSNWNAAVPVAGINSAAQHDHLPFALRSGNQITLAWVRYDGNQPFPWDNPKSDLWYSTSSDGLTWAAPFQVTNDAGNVHNLFPGIYADHSGALWFIWLSTRLGTPQAFELAVANAAQYPQAAVANTALGTGHSHRIAATPTPSVFLGLWVQGMEPAYDVWSRVFSR